MEAVHKKIQNTRQTLRSALVKLVKSKDLREITVAELCREAHINRTTFYKHYAIPGDILTEHVQEVLDMTMEQVNQQQALPPEDRLHDTMLRICRMYYENLDIMQEYMAFNQDLFPILKKYFGGSLKSGLDEEQSLLTFISGGVAYIIMRWGMMDRKQTPEQVAALLTGYIERVSGVQ